MSQMNTHLVSLVDWRDEITLIPFSGTQILDFGFRLDAVELKRAEFIEREMGVVDADGQIERELKPLTGDPALDDPIRNAANPKDDLYTISHERALEPFLSKWVPVPVLREAAKRGIGNDVRFDPGPSNWARIRTVELIEPEARTGYTHRVQLALDTTLMPRQQGTIYLGPLRADAEGSKVFRFVSEPSKMDWFLRRLETDETGLVLDHQQWVSAWLEYLFLAFKTAEKGRPVNPSSLNHQFEHWARYLAYLRLIGTAVSVPKMHFADTVSDRDAVTPVPVELVLDVGNSRTCGILSERLPGDTSQGIGDAFELDVRDLSKPELMYRGLIESRVEFAIHQMGEQSFARRSGRGANFLWPSFVRVGPEAQRLVASEVGNETASGLSSPKRYLWDRDPMTQDWRFHHRRDGMLPSNIFAALRLMNEAGDILGQVASDYDIVERKDKPSLTQPAQRPRCSRSSLFGLMLAELFAHALIQVNSPASRALRKESSRPRKLERIILTLPTATTAQEQAIIKSRAEGALSLVWTMLGLDKTASTISDPPELIVEWDEASSTQLVYLYSELTQKFSGQIDRFLALKGRPRVRPTDPNMHRPQATAVASPSLRLACIDIGGGTTDLMITTYWGEANRMLRPVQTFREGFRKAGDDLLEKIITDIVLPQFQKAIEAAGGHNTRETIAELFDARAGMTQQQVQKRRQFALRVLMPIAVEILKASESLGILDNLTLSASTILRLPRTELENSETALVDASGEALDRALAGRSPVEETAPLVPDDLLLYLEEAAQRVGAVAFRIADVDISCTRQEIDAIARDVLAHLLSNMAEIIDHLGVDVVLLTGRPSRLPAVRAIIENLLVVPPHRLISLHSYKTGAWYPFRDRITQRIGDPKSTVAVGAMLIALSQSRIPNFRVDTTAFRMKSTARYIGVMERNGQILDRNILFADVDLDHKPTAKDREAELELYTPYHIGSRQMALERWSSTPLYLLDFATEAAARAAPLRVKLERAEPDDPDGEEMNAAAALAAQKAREAFRVEEVVDRSGQGRKKEEVTLRLHTLGFASEYWIDTGVFGG